MLRAFVAIICLMSVFTITESSAQGGGSVFGAGLGKKSKNIYGVKKGASKGGRLYGDHGSRIRENYFGKSPQQSGKVAHKQKGNTNTPPSWDDVYRQSSSQSTVNNDQPPPGWETF